MELQLKDESSEGRATRREFLAKGEDFMDRKSVYSRNKSKAGDRRVAQEDAGEVAGTIPCRSELVGHAAGSMRKTEAEINRDKSTVMAVKHVV